nr:YetF domain-containing protein [uncultured Erwinia sp.]
MDAFDWHRFLLDDKPLSFLIEVSLRVLIAYVVVFVFLKVSGRRGIKQLSLFELVVILTLGSAAGDVTFYDDVPVIPVLMVFIVMLLLYRATTFFISKSETFSKLIQGSVITLIADGLYELKSLDGLNISEDEFFMELRQSGVEHLGQVRLALIELDGQLSIYYFEDPHVRPGLSVLPPEHRADFIRVPKDGLYACTHCGLTQHIAGGESPPCPRCRKALWSSALTTRRTQ